MNMPCFLSTVSGLLLGASAMAAPFIVSDPYPPTDLQPTHCEASEGALTFTSPVEVVAGGVRCKIDLAGIPTGNHTMAVRATSTVAGVGASSAAPFSFGVGVLPAPTSLQLILE